MGDIGFRYAIGSRSLRFISFSSFFRLSDRSSCEQSDSVKHNAGLRLP